MEWFSYIADIIGIGGAIFALFAWIQSFQLRKEIAREQRRQHKKITVVLQHGSEDLELPVELRRAELTRAEVLGRLGMIPMKTKGQRFALDYLHTPAFLHQINQISESDEDAILTIPCKSEEFTQFDMGMQRGSR
ncbi:MAG: hypothetical protein MI924_19515 [Chloroflexales bacterium]|nr:hypothetical protein [Chloroflexales bacterium]